MTQAKIFIVFYSTYLHVYQLALAIKQGLEKVNNVQVEIYQIQETLPTEVLEKMHAPPKPDIPVITPEKLQEADGILFGYPTRFGTLPAQLKHFIDACGQLWAKGAMNGKMLGTFVSTATQHGGQETSTFTFLTTLAHFGMLYVPFGYSSAHLNEDTKVMGGSPWGASILAGKDGLRQASPEELEVGSLQGEQFGKIVAQYVSGRPLENNEPPTIAPDANEVTKVVKEETAQTEASNVTASDAKATTRDIGGAEPPNSATLSDKGSELAKKGAQSAVKSGVKHEVKELQHKDGEEPKQEEAKQEEAKPVEEAAPAEEPAAETVNPDAEPTGTVAEAPEAQPESSKDAEGGGDVESSPSKESHSAIKSSGGTIRKLFKRLTLRGKKKTQDNDEH